MQVKTNVKAGFHFVAVVSKASPSLNHNEASVRAAARGLKVQTGVKAGGLKIESRPPPPPPPC
jgi:hypothetical protein